MPITLTRAQEILLRRIAGRRLSADRPSIFVHHSVADSLRSLGLIETRTVVLETGGREPRDFVTTAGREWIGQSDEQAMPPGVTDHFPRDIYYYLRLTAEALGGEVAAVFASEIEDYARDRYEDGRLDGEGGD